MFIDWQPRYSIGVEPMDAAHKQIMKLMNQLHELRATGAGKATMTRTIKELVDFTRGHFSAEEAYMQSIDFPGLKSHKLIHGQLLDQLGKHASTFEASNQPLGNDFFEFLKGWLKAHILGIDTKYGEHARTRR